VHERLRRTEIDFEAERRGLVERFPEIAEVCLPDEELNVASFAGMGWARWPAGLGGSSAHVQRRRRRDEEEAVTSAMTTSWVRPGTCRAAGRLLPRRRVTRWM
jgi:hypothetical protein